MVDLIEFAHFPAEVGHVVRVFPGGGLRSSEVRDLLEERVSTTTVRHLPEPIYWGREIDDERYLISAYK